MKYDRDAPMTPGAWILAFFMVLWIVFWAIVCIWAFVYFAMWFIRFWYPLY